MTLIPSRPFLRDRPGLASWEEGTGAMDGVPHIRKTGEKPPSCD